MENLAALNLKNLDKSLWKTFRFDEIAKNISERVDPNNTDMDVYVGLEHIDSESIHLKRSGTPDDVNGQKLKFYPGDVIFGRRRAYQRKAAVATTLGFCSAHALVLRAHPEVIDPRLFPFFMHSDAFMHRAVDISVGSLSPTINWGALKHQTFLIPPKNQQLEIAELLSSIDIMAVNELTLKDKLLISKLSFIKNEIFERANSGYFEYKKIGELFNIQTGSKNAQDAVENGIYPFFTRALETQTINSFSYDQEALLLPGEGNYQIKYFKGKFEVHQRTYIFSQKKHVKLNLKLYRDIIQEKVGELLHKSVGSTVNSLRKPIIESIEIPFITEKSQLTLFESLQSIEESLFNLQNKIEITKILHKKLINKVF